MATEGRLTPQEIDALLESLEDPDKWGEVKPLSPCAAGVETDLLFVRNYDELVARINRVIYNGVESRAQAEVIEELLKKMRGLRKN